MKNSIEEISKLLESTEPHSAAGVLGGWSTPQSFWQIVDSLPQLPSIERDWDATSGLIENNPPRDLRRYLDQLRTMETLSQCPILAVTGMLNAGKSSLVAGFLSAMGRRRVLIGQSNREGTHRFVLWVPESWRRDPEVWQLTIDQLKSVFGSTPETLGDDLASASRQYNGEQLTKDGKDRDDPGQSVDSLSIPLIATDSMLDRWGLAIMDCPDIQTGLWLQHQGNSETPSDLHSTSLRHPRTESEQSKDRAIHRAKILMQAMQLCSAFIVVAPANGLHDKTIVDLLKAMQTRMPGIDRILVVNRVPRKYLTSQIMEDVVEKLGVFDLRKVYMAYHFEGPLLRERLPSPEAIGLVLDASKEEGSSTEREGQVLPVCFRIDGPNPPQPPTLINTSDYLVSIGSQVDCGKWMGSCRATLIGQLDNAIHLAWSASQREMKERHQRLNRLWQSIADACAAFSLDRKEGDLEPALRLHASQEIVEQLSRSLERTAPWWAQPSRMVVRVAQRTKEAVSKAANRFVPLGWMGTKTQEMVDFVQGKFRRGEIGRVVSASSLVESLRSSDLRGDLGTNQSGLEPRCQSIIDRFQSESRTRLDDSQLDAFTEQIWIRMGWKERLWQGLGPATLAFAPLLAVIAIPLDFGGSSVLVLASLKELLFAGALGAGLALSNRDSMPKIAEQQAAWQQLSDLFAIGCDQLGLPRPQKEPFPQVQIGKSRVGLTPSNVPSGKTSGDPIVPLPVELDSKFLERIEQLIKRLKEEVSP